MIYQNILYQSLKNVTAEWHAGHLQWDYIWSYIKFFDDGSFIYASIQSDNLKAINKSFNKNSNNVTEGRFAINGSLLALQFEKIDI
jgi:hypothetical protein